MRAHILGTGLVLGLAATALAGPVALADTDTDTAPFLAAPGELLVPGQELQIQGYCPDPAAGPLTSDALTDIQILHDPESGPPNLDASGVVAEGTSPGVYPVTMDCAGQTLSIRFTVVDDGQVSRVPRGAPETGDGAQGVSVSLLVLGLALGAAAGAGAIVWREVRR